MNNTTSNHATNENSLGGFSGGRSFSRIVVAMFSLIFLCSVGETAHADAISTTETTVSYAKEIIAKSLGPDFILYPGSIQIDEKTAKIIDIGGMARSALGLEKSEYTVRFKAIHRNEDHYSGRVNMTISADTQSRDETAGDNNTTLRLQDAGTRRNIKIQLYGHEDYPKTITLKDLNLKPLKP